MTPEEADKIINTLKKNGIFYLDGYGKKQIKKGSYIKRGGKNIFDMKNARKLICSKETIKVDGDLKDWRGVKWEDVKGKEHLLAKKDWKGNWDLSFSFASCYDKNNLYLAFKVIDNKRVLRTQTLAQEGDEVQLFVGFIKDPNRENISIGYNGFSFRLIPDKRFQQIYTGQKFLEPVTGSVSRSQVNSKGYVIEASLPWENFNYKAEAGKLLPVEIHVLDADKIAANVEKTMLWNAFEGKTKPWRIKGTTQWGLFQL